MSDFPTFDLLEAPTTETPPPAGFPAKWVPVMDYVHDFLFGSRLGGKAHANKFKLEELWQAQRAARWPGLEAHKISDAPRARRARVFEGIEPALAHAWVAKGYRVESWIESMDYRVPTFRAAAEAANLSIENWALTMASGGMETFTKVKELTGRNADSCREARYPIDEVVSFCQNNLRPLVDMLAEGLDLDQVAELAVANPSTSTQYYAKVKAMGVRPPAVDTSVEREIPTKRVEITLVVEVPDHEYLGFTRSDVETIDWRGVLDGQEISGAQVTATVRDLPAGTTTVVESSDGELLAW